METLTLHINGSKRKVQLKEVVCTVCKKNKFRVTKESKRKTCSNICYLDSLPEAEGKKLKAEHFNRWVNLEYKDV